MLCMSTVLAREQFSLSQSQWYNYLLKLPQNTIGQWWAALCLPQFICWSRNSQRDGVWRWGFRQWIGLGEVMLVGPHGICLIIRRDTREFLFLCLQRDHVTMHCSGHCLEAKKRALPRTLPCCTLMMRSNACRLSQPDHGILYHRLSSPNPVERQRPSERVISINIELF